MVDRRGLAATMLAGLLFGTSVPVIKLGLNFVPPDTFVTLRFAFASALIVLLLRGHGWVQWSLLRSREIWIIGFIGIVFLVSRGQPVNLGSSEVLGDLLILGTAVTIALVFVLSKDLVENKGGRAVTGGIILVTTLLLLPTVPFDRGSSINLAPVAWFYVVFLAVFATVGAYYFFTKGLESVSPTVSSIILPIEVMVAVTLSVIIFSDPFNLYSGTGAFLIIAGVVLVSTAT